MENKSKIKFILFILIVFFVFAGSLIFFLFVKTDKNPTNPIQKEAKKKVEKTSATLFNIPGGTHYDVGFNISQSVTEQDNAVVFEILVTDTPFDTNSQKGIKWLESQKLDLSQTNYVCIPSIHLEATKEEINKCTHLINK